MPELLTQAEPRIMSGAERCRKQRAIVEALLNNGEDARWDIELLRLCEGAQSTRVERLTLLGEVYESLRCLAAKVAEWS